MPDRVTSSSIGTAWHRMPLTKQVALVQSGEVACEEILEHYLHRQQEINPHLRAFSVLEHDRAREDAARMIAEHGDSVQNRYLSNQQGSVAFQKKYFGIISADKDLDRRTGSPNFRGSASTSGEPEAQDDAVTEAVNQAGVISTGRTQVPEFGLTGHSLNGRFAPAENPWKIGINPGGSSSGAAAAVAAGLIPAAVASDAGGSIRIPAASCGVVGYKPSRQYLPYDGKASGNKNSVHGSIARNVADAALLFDAMNPDVAGHLYPALSDDAGPVLTDIVTNTQNASTAAQKRLTILATQYTPWSETLNIELPDAFLTGFDHTIAALRELGHDVVVEELSGFSGYPESFIRLWQKSASLIALSPEEEEGRLLPFTTWLREEGRAHSDALIGKDLDLMQRFEDWFDEETARYDVILTPALGLIGQNHQWHDDSDPVRHFEKQCEYSPYSSYINMVGNCAITLPVLPGSPDTYNIPVSAQLVGKKGSDRALVQLAYALEHHLAVPIVYPYDE